MESYETEINDLPNEIIIKIMRSLEPYDLQKAVLTCKLWKSIIESSCLWSLNVNCAYLYCKNFLSTTERRFRSIKLTGSLLVCGTSALVDFFRRHNSNIFELRLVDVWLNELATIAQILNCLPNLTELTVFRGLRLNYHLNDLRDNELPALPQLRTLKIIATADCRFLMCLKKVKVETLKVINSNCAHSYHCDAFDDFLNTQDGLTTLSVYNSPSMPLNDPMPFQLTRLSLLYEELGEDDCRNVLEFIEKHAQSLKELELGNGFDHTIYESVCTNMTNLETLNLMINEKMQNFGDWRLKKNRSIKSLILKETPYTFFGRRRFFRRIFKCLPNVTNLTILGAYFPKAIMEVAAETLTQLRMIHVSEYHADFRGIHFPNLISLHIDVLNGKMDWQKFSRGHPKLTQFTLDVFNNKNGSTEVSGEHEKDPVLEELAKMTRANVNLHTLKFGEWFKADAHSLEVLRVNSPQLKALELRKNGSVLYEPYDQSWVDVLRFCETNFHRYHFLSSFWSRDDYDFWKKLELPSIYMK